MHESEYIRAVHKLLPKSFYHLKLNLPFTAGVPDCYYSGSRTDLWIEWKLFKSVPLQVDLCSGKFPVLSRLQQDWLISRHREGRAVGVIIGMSKGCVIYPRLSWQHDISRADFIARMVTKQHTALWLEHYCSPKYATAEIAPVAESIALAASSPG